MKIVNVTSSPAIDPAVLREQIAALSPDDMVTLSEMTQQIVRALTTQTGAAVLLSDVEGDGVAGLIAAGNPQLVPHLLYAAADVARQLYTPAGASVQ